MNGGGGEGREGSFGALGTIGGRIRGSSRKNSGMRDAD